ncbi:MAG: hypothetical protein ACYC77_08040 [Coriobacteriia bacterium]
MLALAAQFAFGTDARRAFSPELLGVVSGVFAAAGMVAVAGSPRGLRVASPMAVVTPLILGAVSFVVAPAIVMFHRYSDAPQGSEVLFLTTAAWGAFLALFGASAWKRIPLSLASVVIGLAGVTGIVANWERPSSFSLFIRYQTEETWMLVAGAAWALLWVWMARDTDRQSSTRSAIAAAAGAIVGVVFLALGRGVGLSDIVIAVFSPGAWMYGLATAAVAASATTLVRLMGSAAIAGAYFLPAGALTVITIVEQATTPLGPQPILLGPATAGTITALAACVLLWGDRTDERTVSVASWPAVAASAVAVLAGVVGLFLPALEAHVTGLRSSGQEFAASYILRGHEVMGPWAVLGIALAVLALSAGASHVRARHVAPLLAAGLAWPFVWATPLHTLTRFIPPEVQVDFGSEFASITFTTLAIPATLVALAGAGVGLALLLVSQRRLAVSVTPSRGDIS